jgi:hypothetical protein
VRYAALALVLLLITCTGCETNRQQVEASDDSFDVFSDLFKRYFCRTGDWPSDLDELREFASETDGEAASDEYDWGIFDGRGFRTSSQDGRIDVAMKSHYLHRFVQSTGYGPGRQPRSHGVGWITIRPPKCEHGKPLQSAT